MRKFLIGAVTLMFIGFFAIPSMAVAPPRDGTRETQRERSAERREERRADQREKRVERIKERREWQRERKEKRLREEKNLEQGLTLSAE